MKTQKIVHRNYSIREQTVKHILKIFSRRQLKIYLSTQIKNEINLKK